MTAHPGKGPFGGGRRTEYRLSIFCRLSIQNPDGKSRWTPAEPMLLTPGVSFIEKKESDFYFFLSRTLLISFFLGN